MLSAPNSTGSTRPRYFKCPRCGWVHVGISFEDAEVQVRQAEAFYVVASKINHVTMRGPAAYLESYKRCSRCGAPSADFVPALPGDVQDGWTLQAVIAPNTLRRSSLLGSAEALHLVGALTDAQTGRPQAVVAPRMCEYEFTLKYLLSSDDPNPVELLERLGAAGCTDALVGIREPGCIALEFTRKAESLRDARKSAIADVKRAIPTATLLDDRAKLNDFHVPDDFPRPQHSGAVPGAQPKFLAVEYQGRFYSSGCTPPELYERWRRCVQYVPQFVTSCIETKKGKRAQMPEADILDQYLVRLIETGWVNDDEARWVIREAARLLGWPPPEARMATDEFEPFRGLPLTREQDAEIRAYIARRQANDEAWDTLGFSCMLKDMLAPPSRDDDAAGDEESIDGD